MQEVEWQLDAVDLRPVERWLQAREAAPASEGDAEPALTAPAIAYRPLAARAIADTYFDTADWRLYRAGFALRLRSVNGKHAVTLKTMEGAVDGLRVRTEIEDSLPSADLEALLASESRAAAWVRALVGTHPLHPLFSVQSQRQPYAIFAGGSVVGEIDLDDTVIPPPDDRDAIRLKRVEVEVRPDTVELFSPVLQELRATCRLVPSTSAKFEAGLLAHGLVPRGLPDVGPTGVSADQSIGELAFAILRVHFLALLKHEPGVRIGENTEAVHDMRVAARRMRAALALFSPALPLRAEGLRQELRWIGGVLGAVRDRDIQLERLALWAEEAGDEEVESIRILSAVLEKKRQQSRTRLRRALDSRRYQSLVHRCTSLLQRGPLRRSMNSRTAALVLLPETIAAHHARVLKLGERIDADSAPEKYHRLRIRCKHLRYAVEFSRDVYGPPVDDFVQVMVALQDLLGLHQDAYVAMATLKDLLQRETRGLSPRTLFLMGQISQRYLQEATRLRKRFPKTLRPLNGRAWKRLQRVMEKRRPAAWLLPAQSKSASSPESPGG